MDTVLLREPEIKAALIDRLEEKGLLKNAALINEMVIANWSRRVDLAVANGHLHAFEIKSDFDSLKRLDGQLGSYIARFDKVTVVCSPKFTSEVLKRTPSSVEVLEVSSEGGDVAFRTARRGQLHPIKDRATLLSFLLKAELVMLLKAQSLDVGPQMSRASLEAHASALPITTIRTFVLERLKGRYAKTSESFLKSRNRRRVAHTKVSDLSKLSRIKHQNKGNSPSSTVEATTPFAGDVYSVNWDSLIKRYGTAPECMPGYVLKRRLVNR